MRNSASEDPQVIRASRWYKALRFGAIGIILSGLGACATLSEEECLTADWRGIGYEDGTKGHRESRIAEHRKACADHGVTPDLARYREGREEGLDVFCRPGNGFQAGVDGKTYHNVCPPDLEPDFLDAYESGREIYDLRQEAASLDSDIDSFENDIASLRQEIRDRERELEFGGISDDERSRLRRQIRRKSREIGGLENEILDLEREAARIRGRADALYEDRYYD